MQLHEYPRPANDTGIGVHWSPGFASAVGMAKIREYWIPELRALGVKWVKIFNHDGALDFAQLLLSEGFMPIVRLYRPTPNPGRLGLKELVVIDSLVRAGVRYFECNSEPDRDSEWRGGRLPANGIELVTEGVIADMEAILERGGMPAVPAVSNGSNWDLVGKIIAMGRKDIFDGLVWQAIHNYSVNRPLDFPYDVGNQEGAAYTERFFQLVAEEPWEEHAWRGRSLHDVNRLRLDRAAPGMTSANDHTCFLAYEHFDALNRKHLGRSLPILGVESGYIVGEDSDPRYPATTPNLHMAQTLEMARVMMGVSQRFQAAPEYYFCSAFWLIGNAILGGNSAWWEKHAWYSQRWPGGMLPIVRALKAEPKVARRWAERGQVGERVLLQGMVEHAAERRMVVLEKNGSEVARTVLDDQDRYLFADLLPGRYTVRVPGVEFEQPVELLPSQLEMTLHLTLPPPEEVLSRSVLTGKVRGGAGAVIVLTRRSDGEEWVTMAREDGTYRFVDMPPGIYNVSVSPEGSQVNDIRLDGKNEQAVGLAVAGWGYTIRPYSDTTGVGAFRCIVEGQKGATVHAYSGSWSSEAYFTGDDPNLNVDECEFGGLELGHYIVTVDGIRAGDGRNVQAEGRVHVDKRRIPLLCFVYSDVEQSLPVLASPAVSATLPPLPSVVPTVASAVAMPTMPTSLPTGTTLSRSMIAAHIPNTAGRLARLIDGVGNEKSSIVNADDTVRFSTLAAGVYRLLVEEGYEQSDITVDGSNGVEVLFTPLLPTWEVDVSRAGSMPGFSAVRVEVVGRRNLPVRIWKEDWDGLVANTGSKPEHGEFALEFSPLGPGIYMVEPEGLGIWSDVELTGLEAVWLTFRPKFAPATPNIILSASSLPATEPPSIQPEPVNVLPLPKAASLASEPNSMDASPCIYLWVQNQAVSGAALLKLLRFVAQKQPKIGADLAEALQAEQVLLLGDESDFEQPALKQVMAALTKQGIPYQRMLIDDIIGWM